MPATPLPPVQERQEAFLEAYRMTGIVSVACEASGIPRRTFYNWTETDPAFAERFKEVHEAVVDEAEAELKRRGIHGDDRPVFYQGEKCGSIREKSDACLIFYLKGRRGDVFRDRGEISGPGGGPIAHTVGVDLGQMPVAQLRQMRQWMLEAAQSQGQGAAAALPDVPVPSHQPPSAGESGDA